MNSLSLGVIVGLSVFIPCMVWIVFRQEIILDYRRARHWLRTPHWQREQLAELKREADRRAKIKAPILAVGRADYLKDPKTGQIVGIYVSPEWKFDLTAGAIFQRYDAAGVCYLFGYTVDELAEIHARRAEWVDVAVEK